MTPKQFAEKYWPEAKKAEAQTGVPALVTLAQAAVESGWGGVAPGNMFFGVKDTDGVNGNEQLLTTTEYHNSMNVRYPVVISITPVLIGGKKRYKYRVKDYFRKYKTPADSFADHGQFLRKNQRYARAFQTKDPYKFINAIAAAGYATDPNYAGTLTKVANMIKKYVPAAG